MANLILNDEEKQVDDILDMSDETLGLFVLNTVYLLCTDNEDGVTVGKGIERSSGAMSKVVKERFEGQPTAFNLQLVNKHNQTITYCVSINPGTHNDINEESFSALVDGKRIRTNDNQEFMDHLDNAETVTEVSVVFKK